MKTIQYSNQKDCFSNKKKGSIINEKVEISRR